MLDLHDAGLPWHWSRLSASRYLAQKTGNEQDQDSRQKKGPLFTTRSPCGGPAKAVSNGAFLRVLDEASEQYPVRLSGYCIMPTH